jgi:hypothetical protein
LERIHCIRKAVCRLDGRLPKTEERNASAWTVPTSQAPVKNAAPMSSGKTKASKTDTVYTTVATMNAETESAVLPTGMSRGGKTEGDER